MEHAHTFTIRLAASTLLVGLATTLAGCASLATTAGGPARVSTEAHLEMARDSADLYVAGLIARAPASTESSSHREQLRAQVERYLDELNRRAREAGDAVTGGDDLSPTDPSN